MLERPRLRLVRLAVGSLALWGATCLAFALLESTIHWRAGLGWHGLHCLVGPAHADAVPVLLALSFLAAAVAAACRHVLAWLGRTLARLDDSLPAGSPPLLPAVLQGCLCVATAARSSLGSRAPPRWTVRSVPGRRPVNRLRKELIECTAIARGGGSSPSG